MIRVPRSVTNFSNLHYEIRGFFEMKRGVRIDVTEHDPALNVDAPVTTTSLLYAIDGPLGTQICAALRKVSNFSQRKIRQA
ncbi:hypothetical protein AGR6A_pTi0048 [Agrobacterium sp. NCPPB 925]|uniref:Uncharacterized protein n=1 Tax=Agrobacterium genomosp. 6 TaxID=1183411 RepID=A0A2Z2PE96_9HYPH|nr:hypothetical protein [Agrobacterium genomosp. 6]ASK41363.1 hypothetical protein [Agrobacterium genomosp. 6]CUX71294.1 hypothetical protein AGR6A_pTi0048 [Agrobacterium sp. NCPPB 925]